jgi:hypothetical protein
MKFEEIDLCARESSTLVLGYTRADENGLGENLIAIALLDDEIHNWLIYHTNVEGAQRLIELLQSKINEVPK